MSNYTEEIDKLIKETLTQEEAKFYDGLEEQNVFQMLGGLFQGKNKWLLLLTNIVILAFSVLFMYCVVQFFNVESTKELLMWGIGGLMSLSAVSMLKLFAWMQMDKNAILREIKRLELQVSSLAGRISR
jgi:hypothetical protein